MEEVYSYGESLELMLNKLRMRRLSWDSDTYIYINKKNEELKKTGRFDDFDSDRDIPEHITISIDGEDSLWTPNESDVNAEDYVVYM